MLNAKAMCIDLPSVLGAPTVYGWRECCGEQDRHVLYPHASYGPVGGGHSMMIPCDVRLLHADCVQGS